MHTVMSIRARPTAAAAPRDFYCPSRLDRVLGVGYNANVGMLQASTETILHQKKHSCKPNGGTLEEWSAVFDVGSNNWYGTKERMTAAVTMEGPNFKESNQDIGTMTGNIPVPVAITHDPMGLKQNSGTLNDWMTFSNKVIELAEVPEKSKKYYNRDGMMMLLKDALAFQMYADASPLVMHASDQTPSLFRTVDSPAHLAENVDQGPNVILVKMWGFAGMHDAEEMISLYQKGVDALFAMEDFKAAMDINAHVVLHFDGDYAYEKKNEKFSHNLFAPFVSSAIKAKTHGQLPVHLVITKVDSVEPDETIVTLVQKFCNSDNGFANCSFRTQLLPGVAHSYPYYDRRFFDSAALYVSEPTIQSVGSEGQNSMMMEQLFRGKVVSRFCLGIGGNTKAKGLGGVASMLQFIDQGDAFPFNGAVRVNVTATNK